MTATRKRKPQVDAVDFGTRERRLKGDIRITDAPARADRRARAESSVERIAARKDADGQPLLSSAHLAAAKRYYSCATAYGYFGRYASMDLGKEVFGARVDDGAERLEDLKREYVAATDCVSGRWRTAMQSILLRDATLTEAGKMMGGKGERAGQVALPVLIDTLDRLAVFFWADGKPALTLASKSGRNGYNV